MKKASGRCCIALLVLTLLLSAALAGSVSAQSHTHGAQTGDIRIHMHSSDGSLHPAGVLFMLYEVAEGSYFEDQAHLLPDFEEDLTHLSLTEIVTHSREDSLILEDWVEHVHPTADIQEAYTDDEGFVEFDHLEEGVYLVCEVDTELELEEAMYEVHVEPFLVEIPMMDDEGNLYDLVDCDPKMSLFSLSPDLLTIEVEKHWDDQNNKAGIRPGFIEAELYAGDEWAGKAMLSAANNWHYAWTDLDPDVSWSVKEAGVPDGYQSEVIREGNTFIITNTLEEESTSPPEEESSTPPEEETTSPEEPTAPEEETTVPVKETTTQPEKSTTKPRETATPPRETTPPPTEPWYWNPPTDWTPPYYWNPPTEPERKPSEDGLVDISDDPVPKALPGGAAQTGDVHDTAAYMLLAGVALMILLAGGGLMIFRRKSRKE